MIENIFDTHAHYDDDRFEEDREQVIESLVQKGVKAVLNAGCSLESSKAGIEMAEKYPFFYASVGIHPHDAKTAQGDYLSTLQTYAKNQKVRAIGEIGLDYYYDLSPREDQKRVFEEQLTLAKELDMPVIIHNRDAHGDTLELLKKYRPKGIVHCYSGSAELAAEIVNLGMYLGFTGALTFKNARRAIEAVAVIPQDRLLLETDCPYMAPEPFRGKRCDSSLIAYTAAKMAEIKNLDVQKMVDITTENAYTVYEIPHH